MKKFPEKYLSPPYLNARALFRNPQLLLIGQTYYLLLASDEGASAMDRNTEQFILNLLNNLKSKKAIMIVSHRMKVASFSDYIYILEKGKITAEGSPEALVKEENFFSRALNELNQAVGLN